MRQVQEEFDAVCRKILATHVDLVDDETTFELLLNAGAAERAIAGDHHDRHLLELLQNARDAIFHDPNERTGRVLIAVTENGIAVANTGVPFDLLDENIRKAVQYLDRSQKGGERGFIGHKGIGLKSVLLSAGAFQVRTWLSATEALRAQFSRALTGAAIRSEDRAVLVDFPRMPVFLQPHPLSEHDRGRDADLLEDLLKDGAPVRHEPEGLDAQGQPTTLPRYSTVVYLPYADEPWERMLDAKREQLPAEMREKFDEARRERAGTTTVRSAWKEARALDPRIVLLLGEIDELQIVRFERSEITQAIRYDIDHPILFGERKNARDLKLTTRTWPQNRTNGSTFRMYSRRIPGEDEPTRILIEVPSAGQSIRPPELAPCLYYPMPATALRLPFLLHGPFHVTSNRKDLVYDDRHNDKVLRACLKLVESALIDLARLYPAQMPWLVAPRRDLGGADKLAWFADRLQDLLKETPCVPTGQGALRGRQVLFDPKRPDKLSAALGGPRLAPASLRTYAELLRASEEEAANAAAAVGLGEILLDPVAFCDAVREAWRGAEGDLAVSVEKPEAAVGWFEFVTAVMNQNPDVAEAIASRLGQDEVPLVPVRTARRTVLVRAMTRPGPGKPIRRVLFWRPKGQSRKAIGRLPDSVNVFMADSADLGTGKGILDSFDEQLGTAQFRGIPDLLLQVADGLVNKPADQVLAVLPWLAATLEPARGGESSPFRGHLSPHCRPAQVWHMRNHWDAATRRNRRHRMALLQRLGALMLWTKGGSARARDCHFGAGWAALFEPEQAAAVEAYGRFAELADSRLTELAPPDDPRWSGSAKALRPLLVALGVAVGPPLCFRWVRTGRSRPLGSADDEASISQSKALEWTREGPGLHPPSERALAAWRIRMREAGNHPAFTAWHSPSCPMREPGWPKNAGVFAACWTWFPDLASAEAWPAEAQRAWRESLLAIYDDIRERILYTGLLCVHYHDLRHLHSDVPSLARVQLEEAPIWDLSAKIGPRRGPLADAVLWPEKIDLQRSVEAHLPAARGLPRKLLSDLGVVRIAELRPSQASRLLAGLLAERRSGEPIDGGSFQLKKAPSAQWTGCVNRLTAQLMANLNDELDSGSSEEESWRRHELDLWPLLLRASRGDQSWALQLTKTSAELATVFNVSPTRNDLASVGDRFVLRGLSSSRSDLVALAKIYGIKSRGHDPAPRIEKTRMAPERRRRPLEAAVRERLGLILGVLSADGIEDLDERAEMILDALQQLEEMVDRPVGRAHSGISVRGNLAYWSDREPVPIWVLAEGLAELCQRPGLALFMDHALQADPERVEQMLESRGVFVAELREQVALLAEERDRDREARRAAAAEWLGTGARPALLELAADASSDDKRLAFLREAICDRCSEIPSKLLPSDLRLTRILSPKLHLGIALCVAVAGSDAEEPELQALLGALGEARAHIDSCTVVSSVGDILGSPHAELALELDEARWRACMPSLPAWAQAEWDHAESLTDLSLRLGRRTRVAGREVDEHLDEIDFPENAFLCEASAAPKASPVPPGRTGSGGGGGITLAQAQRGRVAERWVLEDCWRRYQKLVSKDKKLLAKVCLARRKSGWSTQAAATRIEEALRKRSTDLERDELFALLDISNERGPGFDVIDPFGIRPVPDERFAPERLRKVEVKAIDRRAPRAFLTSNEYHKARFDPERYVIRLIAVPTDWKAELARVAFIADIEDPVGTLDLEQAVVEAVRGGKLPLKITL